MAWTDNTTLLREWDYTDLNPVNLVDDSHKMAWWKCKNGYGGKLRLGIELYEAIVAHIIVADTL